MKILLVNKYWYLRGGSERIVFSTKELLEKAGHTVAVFGMKDSRNIFSNDYFIDEINFRKSKGIEKIIVGLKSIYNFDAKKRFRHLVQEFQPDVIHFHNIYHQLSFSLLDVVKELHIPSVMTLHDYKMISPNYNLFHHGAIDESCIRGSYWKCLMKNCLENFSFSLIATIEAYLRQWKKWNQVIDAYICPSDFLKKKFIEAGWDENKLSTIVYPCIVPKVKYVKSENSNVVFFGRLSSEKGLHVLFEAAKKTPNINYKIIGIGPLYNELKNKITNKKISNVVLLGYKNGDELWSLVASAGVVVVPSIWYETGGPMTVAEALSIGVPVIASAIGSISEVLPQNLLVPPNDSSALAQKISEWFAKPEEEKENIMTELQKKTIQKYDPEQYLKKLEDLYRQVVGE